MQNIPSPFILSICLLVLLSVFSCRKETITVTDNESTAVNAIPQIRIENYVNRVFIDLLGREPLDSEMQKAVTDLKLSQLSTEARKELITTLQYDESFIEGDTSYLQAIHQNLYNLAKIRCLEGASDNVIKEFISGNNSDESIAKLNAVLAARKNMQKGLISYHELFAIVINNAVYDEINMNTFNFINASFDNLLSRFPTDAEMQAGFDMIDDNESSTLFGESGQSKADYIFILTSSREMSEGLIIWAYQQLLSRSPTTLETLELLESYHNEKDIRVVQLHIMSSEEYTDF